MSEPFRSHELIMVRGVQRSGTNVLFDSSISANGIPGE
jgi:hypothetical protein